MHGLPAWMVQSGTDCSILAGMDETGPGTTQRLRRGAVPLACPSHYWRSWLPELVVLAVLAALAAWLFTGTSLDMRIAAAFLSGGRFPRPAELPWPWRFLYESVGAVVVIMAAAAAAVLATGLYSAAWRRWRPHAAFALLAVAIGPGVVVNVGFKNFWGRPRPVHVRGLGGAWEYQDAVDRGTPGRGKSFPCGHSSVGYVLTVFWLIWKRCHWRWAASWLAVALVYGTALGIGRMMTGSHFASDVVASGLMVHLSNVILYYFVLNIPGREDAPPPDSLAIRIPPAAVAGWSALGAAVVVASFVATPYYSEFRHAVPSAGRDNHPWSAMDLIFPPQQVTLSLYPCDAPSVSGQAEGFGMFGSQLHRLGPAAGLGRALRFEARPTGWFSDLSIRFDVGVPTCGVQTVRVFQPGGGLAISTPKGAPWTVDVSGVRGPVSLAAQGAPADSLDGAAALSAGRKPRSSRR